MSKDSLDAPINYAAEDSFRIDIKEKVIRLYGNANVQYKEIDLQAERIDFYWEKSEVVAYGVFDSTQMKMVGIPQFTEGSSIYLAEHFRYNFKTGKGKSKGMVAKESEGYLHGTNVKSIGQDVLFGSKLRYTTCNYEHPHFYIEIDKAKIIKDKVIVGKPANLVIEDVRTPLWLPFGFYPMIKNRNSGLIQPNFRFDYSDLNGYGIEQLGFYWAINDNLGFKTYANVYTHGTHSIYALLDYRKRYKFSGNLDVIYFSRVTGERRDPDFAGADRSLKFLWNLTVDPKRLVNSNFSINANIETSGFNKNIIGDGENYLNNTLSSSISYSKNWPGKPVRLSLSANHSQNTSTGIINLTVPSLTFNMSSVNPFAKLGKTSERKWYDDIYVTYNLRTEGRIRAADSTFFSQETLDGLRFGVRQEASMGSKIRLFKYINVTPTFNYREYWYPDALIKTFQDTLVQDGDTLVNQIVEERDYGFQTARDFSLSLDASWTLYGTFNFKNRKHVKAFRHVVRPSVGFQYQPNFRADRWGYYETVATNTEGGELSYSRFEDGIYGGPSGQELLNLRFSVTNDFEMKVATKRDTTGELKKIKLLSGMRVSGNYNIAKDSVRLSDFAFSSGSTEIYKGIRINFSGSFTPYYIDPATNQTLDRFLVKETGRLFRLKTFRLSVSGTFKSKQSTGNNSTYSSGVRNIDYEPFYNDPYWGNRYDYVDFSVPWSMRVNYDMNLRKQFSNSKDTTLLTHSATMNFDFSLTPKWQIKTSMRYNFTDMEINNATVSINRDLHCWYLFLNWSPVGRETIAFGVRIKSSQLGFLNRLEKSIPNNGSITDISGFGL